MLMEDSVARGSGEIKYHKTIRSCYMCQGPFPVVCTTVMGLPWWLSGKESAYSAGDAGSIPGLGRSPGGGHNNPL